jgi:hypothetical protein
MLEHYSHIRLDAKRKALDGLEEARGREEPTDAAPVGPTDAPETVQ